MAALRATPRAATVVLALLILGTAPVLASSRPKRAKPVTSSPLLWATVNVCDTADHPDTVGIRGSMPGSGRSDEEMYMRFQLQYLRQSDKTWHNITPKGDSGFLAVGSARYKARQKGVNFVVPPPSTGAFILRGAVTFEWRRDGDVVRRARERTESGHPGTKGADPADFSAATCQVKQ